MRTSLRILIYVAGLAVLLTTSCEKTPEAPILDAARAEVTITNYFNEDGTKNIKTWGARDVLGIFNADAGDVSVTNATPLLPGNQSSRFIFSTDAKNGDNIVAYYPATAASYENGAVQTNLNTIQNGTAEPFYIGKAPFAESDIAPTKITIDPLWCTVYANISIGDYAIKKAVLKGNNGEKIAGNIRINPSDMSVEATETTVTVEFDTALDCRLHEQTFIILISPVTFSKGYTITYTTETGSEFTYTTQDSIVGQAGRKIDADGAKGDETTQLLVCGDNMIYHINADIAADKGFSSSIIWQWDSKDVMSVIGKDGLRLDECKPVEDNTKILVTSSRGFALILEKETKKMLWYSNISRNAHSAELLPGNRIVIACSEEGDCLQVFDRDKSNKVLFSTPLANAHGVVWVEKHQRLYAIGGNYLFIYKLNNWDSATPELTLEKQISTKNIVNSTHDLTYVNPDTILISGKYSALYNITTGTFTQLKRFMSSSALKAVNYNITTGECWYVDATIAEGDFAWSSKTIHYTDNVQSTDSDKKTITNVPINMYKCRVLNW